MKAQMMKEVVKGDEVGQAECSQSEGGLGTSSGVNKQHEFHQ